MAAEPGCGAQLVFSWMSGNEPPAKWSVGGGLSRRQRSNEGSPNARHASSQPRKGLMTGWGSDAHGDEKEGGFMCFVKTVRANAGETASRPRHAVLSPLPPAHTFESCEGFKVLTCRGQRQREGHCSQRHAVYGTIGSHDMTPIKRLRCGAAGRSRCQHHMSDSWTLQPCPSCATVPCYLLSASSLQL